jgi:hypothetical protein
MKRSLILVTLAIALLTPALAGAFNPKTQSHLGACSETTADVHQAVGDLSANGVLADYAEVLGIKSEGKSPTAAAEAQLVVARLAHGTTADNHGCELGVVFPVGPRRLHKGERVAIHVPASLKARLCAGPGTNCVAKRVRRRHVLPINCWNLDEADAVVILYVRKQPPPPAPAPEPDLAMPSAKAHLSCTAGAVLVELRNDPQASAAASFLVNGTHQGPVGHGGVRTVSVPVANGRSVKVTVQSGSKTLLEHLYTSDCGAPATPVSSPPPSKSVTSKVLPAAAATLTCNQDEFGINQSGGIDVTLYNAATATSPASFAVVVNGASHTYGPLQPGEIQTIPGPEFTIEEVESEGLVFEVEIRSGGTLLYSETYEEPCVIRG